MPGVPISCANGAALSPIDVPVNSRMAVYALRHRGNQKVYVGMTSQPVIVRWRQHQSDTRRSKRSYHFANALRAYGAEAFDLYILSLHSSREEMCTAERAWIRAFDSCHSDHGFNSTTGGERTYRLSDATKQKISAMQIGKKLSPEHKRKVSAALKGRRVSPELMEALRLTRVGATASETTRTRLRSSHLGKSASEETRRKMSEAHRRRWADPDNRAKVTASLRKKASDMELQRRKGESMRRAIAADPSIVTRGVETRRQRMTDETREKLRAAAARRWTAMGV